MSQVAIPTAARVVCRQVRTAEEVVNVFHVGVDALTLAAATTIQQRFENFYGNDSTAVVGERGIRDHLEDDLTLTSITVQDIGAVPYDNPFEFFPGIDGTSSGVPLPASNCLLVQWRTPIGGRSGKGRTYLGGFTELHNEEAVNSGIGRPTSALLTAVNNACEDLVEGLDADGFNLGVASYTDAVLRAVNGWRIANKWSTQRRRQAAVEATSVVTGSIVL